MSNNTLPETGYARLTQIIGNPKKDPPTPAYIPVSKSTWWEGVKTGRFPRPIKLSPGVTVWRVEEVRAIGTHIYRTAWMSDYLSSEV